MLIQVGGYMKENLVSSGMTATDSYNNGAGLSDDYFPYNYKYIRHAFLGHREYR